MRIQDWPSGERPYEKMERFGSAALTDAELIAILLSSGVSGLTSVDLAKKLLAQNRDITGLHLAGLEELQEVQGIGRVKALRLKTAIELGLRISQSYRLQQDESLGSCREAGRFFENKLKYLPQEEFHVALLNSRNHLIRVVRISQGGLNAAAVQPRDLFRDAIKANAANIILAHNHPSGDPTPSESDIRATRTIAELGDRLGIQILDHIIVGSKRTISLKQQGYF